VANIRNVDGMKLWSADGKRFGTIEHVLFHPVKPHVVGFQILKTPWLYMIDRRPVFVPLDEVEITKEKLILRAKKPVTGKAAEKRQGFEWEKTVIWAGMPVCTKSGEEAGVIKDVQFRASGGTVRKVKLTGGMTADAAIGTREIEGDRLVSFDGEHVIIEDIAEKEFDGGFAKQAGKGSAVATVTAEVAAKKAYAAGVAGAKVALDSEMGKKAARAFNIFKKAAKDAIIVDDEEE